MKQTGLDIDWTWEAPHNEIDTVWYAKTAEGQLMVAGNPKFDALVIADTAEEIQSLGEEFGHTTFLSDPKPVVPAQASLSALASRWRWYIYKGKARFLHAGKGWLPQTLAEYPGVRSAIAPDPMAIVYFCRNGKGIIERNGFPVVGGDVHELIDELNQIDEMGGPGIEFSVMPLFAFAARNEHVWYRGQAHNLVEALVRNPKLLAHHEMIDLDDTKKDENK